MLRDTSLLAELERMLNICRKNLDTAQNTTTLTSVVAPEPVAGTSNTVPQEDIALTDVEKQRLQNKWFVKHIQDLSDISMLKVQRSAPKVNEKRIKLEKINANKNRIRAAREAPLENFSINSKSNKVDEYTSVADENAKKPLFKVQPMGTVKPRNFSQRFLEFITGRPQHRRAVTHGMCDLDLTYRLKLHSALQPRTMTLANSLKMRAIRMVEEYNMKDIDTSTIYDLVMFSVAEAMVIDPSEECLRTRMQQDAERQRDMQPFLMNGQVKLDGLLSRPLSLGRTT